MAKPMMKCGHAANGRLINKDGTSQPACVICNCIEPATERPNLEGRKARCSYYDIKCKSERDSSTDLPFFEHHPDQEYDEYYCGCWGWN